MVAVCGARRRVSETKTILPAASLDFVSGMAITAILGAVSVSPPPGSLFSWSINMSSSHQQTVLIKMVFRDHISRTSSSTHAKQQHQQQQDSNEVCAPQADEEADMRTGNNNGEGTAPSGDANRSNNRWHLALFLPNFKIIPRRPREKVTRGAV